MEKARPVQIYEGYGLSICASFCETKLGNMLTKNLANCATAWNLASDMWMTILFLVIFRQANSAVLLDFVHSPNVRSDEGDDLE